MGHKRKGILPVANMGDSSVKKRRLSGELVDAVRDLSSNVKELSTKLGEQEAINELTIAIKDCRGDLSAFLLALKSAKLSLTFEKK